MVNPSGVPREYIVEGTTFSPIGSVKSADGKDASAELRPELLVRLAEISSLCNDSRIVYHTVSGLLLRSALQCLISLIGQGHIL